MHLLLWIILLIVAWPIALMALILYPFVWLISIPFQLVGILVQGIVELFRTLVFLPSRLID